MKRSAMLMGVLVFLMAPMMAAAFMPGISYQDDAAKAAEAAAYAAWYEAYTAKDLEKGFDLSKAFLAKFPNSDKAAYMKKYIVTTRAQLFNKARTDKNIPEEIKLGNEALAEDPENLEYLFLLSLDIRSNELFTSPPNYSHSNELVDYSRRTVKLLEAGKVPTVVDKTKWNQNQQLGALYDSLARIEAKNKSNDKALELFKKAASLDSSNASYFFALGSLYNEKYMVAATKYAAFPQTDREATEPKPEIKTALDEANANADMVIENWAKFMALTIGSDPWKPTRDQVNTSLTAMYKYRHPDDVDGLQKLIDKYKSNGSPAGSSAAAASTKQ